MRELRELFFTKSQPISTAGLALPSMVSDDLLDLIGDTGIIESICPLRAEEALLLEGLCLGDSSASETDPTEFFFPLLELQRIKNIKVRKILCYILSMFHKI